MKNRYQTKLKLKKEGISNLRESKGNQKLSPLMSPINIITITITTIEN